MVDGAKRPSVGERVRQAAEILAHSCPVMDAVERLVDLSNPTVVFARRRGDLHASHASKK